MSADANAIKVQGPDTFPGNPIATAAATATTGGVSVYRNISLLATGINIKASAGQVYGWILCNNAASVRFVKLFNKATAPAVGTDTPVITIELPANSTGQYAIPPGIAFSLGIGIGATNLVADADNTAPSANDVVANVLYA